MQIIRETMDALPALLLLFLLSAVLTVGGISLLYGVGQLTIFRSGKR